MKLAAMQSYFLPYLGYFQLIQSVDIFLLVSGLNFNKQGWMNRNRILIKNQNVYTISIPLNKRSQNKLINQVKINRDKPWATRLISTIYTNYKGAPYFDEVFPTLHDSLSISFEYLYQLNGHLIETICNLLDIKTEIKYDNTAKYLALEERLRDIEDNNYYQFDYLNKTKPLKRVARIIEICKMEKANVYINAIGGQELYNKEEFLVYGIDLKFIKTEELVYTQFSEYFKPNLSIVDVLMHNGIAGTSKMLKKYTLV